MPALSQSVQAIFNSPPSNLNISFPATILTTHGQQVPKEDAQPTPTLHLKNALPSKTYCSMALDPDAPFPFFPILGPVLHGFQTGLVTDGAPDADGFIKLRASGEAVASWAPPGPPPISSPHRYVFLVWEQPEGLTDAKVRTAMGWGKKVTIPNRMRWDQAAFEKKFGLGECIAGSWFVSGWE